MCSRIITSFPVSNYVFFCLLLKNTNTQNFFQVMWTKDGIVVSGIQSKKGTKTNLNERMQRLVGAKKSRVQVKPPPLRFLLFSISWAIELSKIWWTSYSVHTPPPRYLRMESLTKVHRLWRVVLTWWPGTVAVCWAWVLVVYTLPRETLYML